MNGLQSQLDYMLDVVDKCRADRLTGRLSATLADNVSAVIERHGKLQTDVADTLSQIERAQNNVQDFEVRWRFFCSARDLYIQAACLWLCVCII